MKIVSATIPASVRWLLMLFVFSIPFEMYPSKFTSGSLSLAKIAGALFIAVYLSHYNPFSRTRSLPRFPPAMKWFVGYLTVYTLNGFFVPPQFFDSFLSRFFTLAQLVVLFWIVSDLLRDERLARKALLIYAVGTVLLALGMIMGLTGFSVTYKGIGGMRFSSLAYNPNSLALLMSVTLLILMGLYLIEPHGRFVNKLGLIILGIPLLPIVVSTGSRTGMAVLAMGFLTYLIPSRRYRGKVTIPILVMLVIAALVYVVAQNSMAVSRWERTYYTGETAGRVGIFTQSLGMILERPIFGWQPIAFWYELGRRVLGYWRIRDAHNSFLHLFLEVGAVGAIPFMIGVWLCGRAAWRARHRTFGLLPLALLVTTLVANLFTTELARKQLWLVLAIAVAAEPLADRRRAAALTSPASASTLPGVTLPQPSPYERNRRGATF